jgi:hypothetical protein
VRDVKRASGYDTETLRARAFRRVPKTSESTRWRSVRPASAGRRSVEDFLPGLACVRPVQDTAQVDERPGAAQLQWRVRLRWDCD